MSWIDAAILLMVAISAVIGLFRGFVKEAVALGTWIAAVWLAVGFSKTVAGWLPQSLERGNLSVGGTNFEISNMRVGIACVLLIVGALIVGATINYLLGKVTKAKLLKGADRFLGLAFGVARGMAVVLVMVLAAGLTKAPQTDLWREARLLPPFEQGAIGLLDVLPKGFAQHFSFAEEVL